MPDRVMMYSSHILVDIIRAMIKQTTLAKYIHLDDRARWLIYDDDRSTNSDPYELYDIAECINHIREVS